MCKPDFFTGSSFLLETEEEEEKSEMPEVKLDEEWPDVFNGEVEAAEIGFEEMEVATVEEEGAYLAAFGSAGDEMEEVERAEEKGINGGKDPVKKWGGDG